MVKLYFTSDKNVLVNFVAKIEYFNGAKWETLATLKPSNTETVQVDVTKYPKSQLYVVYQKILPGKNFKLTVVRYQKPVEVNKTAAAILVSIWVGSILCCCAVICVICICCCCITKCIYDAIKKTTVGAIDKTE